MLTRAPRHVYAPGMNQISYPIGLAAQKLGVSVDTLRRWEREGKHKPTRNAAGHRRYTDDDIDTLRAEHSRSHDA